MQRQHDHYLKDFLSSREALIFKSRATTMSNFSATCHIITQQMCHLLEMLLDEVYSLHLMELHSPPRPCPPPHNTDSQLGGTPEFTNDPDNWLLVVARIAFYSFQLILQFSSF